MLMLVTGLAPVIATTRRRSRPLPWHNDLTLRKGIELAYVPSEFDRVVDPAKMVKPSSRRSDAANRSGGGDPMSCLCCFLRDRRCRLAWPG